MVAEYNRRRAALLATKAESPAFAAAAAAAAAVPALAHPLAQGTYRSVRMHVANYAHTSLVSSLPYTFQLLSPVDARGTVDGAPFELRSRVENGMPRILRQVTSFPLAPLHHWRLLDGPLRLLCDGDIAFATRVELDPDSVTSEHLASYQLRLSGLKALVPPDRMLDPLVAAMVEW